LTHIPLIAIPARWMLVLTALLLTSLPACAPSAPNIAAAADLRLALTEVAAAFKRNSGEDVVLSFGSSGTFFRQLQQGAPYQLFLSADEAYVLALAKAGKTEDTGTLYAIGRLALVAPKGSPLAVDSQLSGLRRALAQGQISRFAIANPAHAPYGARADHALLPAAWHQPLRQRMVLMTGAGPVARRFHAYLQQPEARRIFVRYGFALPGGG